MVWCLSVWTWITVGAVYCSALHHMFDMMCLCVFFIVSLFAWRLLNLTPYLSVGLHQGDTRIHARARAHTHTHTHTVHQRNLIAGAMGAPRNTSSPSHPHTHTHIDWSLSYQLLHYQMNIIYIIYYLIIMLLTSIFIIIALHSTGTVPF